MKPKPSATSRKEDRMPETEYTQDKRRVEKLLGESMTDTHFDAGWDRGYQKALKDVLASLPEEKEFVDPRSQILELKGFNSCLKLVHEGIERLRK